MRGAHDRADDSERRTPPSPGARQVIEVTGTCDRCHRPMCAMLLLFSRSNRGKNNEDGCAECPAIYASAGAGAQEHLSSAPAWRTTICGRLPTGPDAGRRRHGHRQTASRLLAPAGTDLVQRRLRPSVAVLQRRPGPLSAEVRREIVFSLWHTHWREGLVCQPDYAWREPPAASFRFP